MTLIQLFPDVSIHRRSASSLRISNSRMREKNAKKVLSVDEATTRFSDNEFMKWHVKLIFIIVSILAVLYMMILNLSELLRWMLQ